MAIGTSELNDAFAALGEVEWTRRGPFKEALAATLAKSPDDRRIFDLVFERYFFRATEGAAIESGVREGDAQQRGGQTGDRIDFDELREQILEAIRAGDESALADLARLAIAAFGRRGEGSGVLGVDVQRIRRALGLKSEPSGLVKGEGAPQELPLTRDQIRRFEAHLRRELERAQIERTQALPPAARSTSSTARSRAARRRTSPPCTASSPSSSAASPPRATRPAATPATPTSTCARRCAPRWRPAASPSS